jgi:hypothetical protein
MTYRIEITAETLTELAGKTLALAAQFQVTAADPVMPEVKAATRKPKPAKVEEPQADEGNAPSEAVSSGETEASPTVQSGTEPETPTTGEPQEPAALEINVIRDVQPLVLSAIDKTSKERISALIQSYGAERVTKLDPSKLPALIADLKEILG